MNDIIYTTTFKTYRVEIDSPLIELSKSAWIEKSNIFEEDPKIYNRSMFMLSGMDEDPNYSQLNFFKKLSNSSVRLRTVHTGKESEKSPFQLHDCSYIAIAIAILCDHWFVAGLETFQNNRTVSPASLGSGYAFFLGSNSTDPVVIKRDDEINLKNIYEFVYKKLTTLSWEDDDAKLLLLFSRCVVKSPMPRMSVLKLGLSHLFTEWDDLILNSALFFESLLTKESRKVLKGAKEWNKHFAPEFSIDEELIDVVFQYRHCVSHANPTDAQKKILAWKEKIALDDLKVAQVLKTGIWRTARLCMRAMISNESKYLEFRRMRPN